MRPMVWLFLSTNIAELPDISEIEGIFVLITGHPDFIASRTGMPKPSWLEGYNKQ